MSSDFAPKSGLHLNKLHLELGCKCKLHPNWTLLTNLERHRHCMPTPNWSQQLLPCKRWILSTATTRPRWFHKSSLADCEVGLPYIVRWLIDPVVSHCSWRLMQNFTNIHTWKVVHTVPSETSQEEHQKQTQPLMGLLWVQTCFCPVVIPRQVSLLANAAPTFWG